MDSFYLVQSYEFLRDNAAARRGGEGKFLSDMYKNICSGRELTFNQKSGLTRSLFHLRLVVLTRKKGLSTEP